jgi:hypothetical protein
MPVTAIMANTYEGYQSGLEKYPEVFKRQTLISGYFG